MAVLVAAKERLDEALDDSELEDLTEQQFQTWKRKHSNTLRRVNQRISNDRGVSFEIGSVCCVSGKVKQL